MPKGTLDLRLKLSEADCQCVTHTYLHRKQLTAHCFRNTYLNMDVCRALEATRARKASVESQLEEGGCGY